MHYRTTPDLTLIAAGDRRHLFSATALAHWDPHSLRDERLVEILCFCTRPHTEEAIIQELCNFGLTREEAGQALAELVDAGILSVASPDGDGPDRASAWSDRGWEDARLYHFHTRALPRMDYASDPKLKADQAIMREYVAAEPAPPAFLSFNGDRVALTPSHGGHDVPVTFRVAHSRQIRPEVAEPRPPVQRRLSLEELGSIISLAFGKTGERRLPVTGLHPTKTSPSGGSRHPIELYVASTDVEGLRNGLYHFDVPANALTRLFSSSRSDELCAAIYPGWHTKVTPAAILLLTAVFERSMFRYRESRSYRIVHHDVGHLIHTTRLLASAFNLECYAGYALDDEVIEEVIGISGLDQPVLAAIVLGFAGDLVS